MICSLFLVTAAPARACRLALLLAVDISASIDDAEFRLQRDGLADALTSPAVAGALLASRDAPVALSVYEFSGAHHQDQVVGWTIVRAAGDLAAIARTLRRTPRTNKEFPTSLGYAIGYAATLFRTAPDCLFQKLDVSGDGVNNDGFPPALAYKNFPLANVTVNGLAIGGDDGLANLVRYYRDEVIRGPGAFVETANDHRDFRDAIERKLLREIETLVVSDLQR